MIGVARRFFQLRFLILLFSFLCCGVLLHAQSSPVPDHDTSYYISYPKNIIGRFYFIKKYTSLDLQKATGESQLRYQPHTPLNLGIGATYHTLSANLSFGVAFLDPNHVQGKTKSIDFQTHFYGRKWIADLLVQFYKGYHLNPQGLAANDPQAYYIRPDLRINVVGAAAYYLFNYGRFTYRAPMFQDERQKLSAGSFLLGGESYYGVMKADSSLTPTLLAGTIAPADFRSLRFFKIGPGIGYAYTFVFQKDFYFTASLQANLSLDIVHQSNLLDESNKVSFSPGYIYRLVAGYNKGIYSVNVSLVGNQLALKTGSSDDRFYISTGAYQLTFARRFVPGRRLFKRLRPVRDLLPVPEG